MTRGGLFGDPEGFLHTANRGRANPETRQPFIRFCGPISRWPACD